MDPSELLPSPAVSESLDMLKEHYPQEHAELLREGYEAAAANLLGRCQSDATLFLEIDHRRGLVCAWIWSLRDERFIGATYHVFGPLGPAVSKARHLVESAYAEDRLSFSLPRYSDAIVETVFVD